MRFCPSCRNETDGSYCSKCGHETISSMMIEPIIKKKSKFWYLLPIIFGLLGGAIAYFALRKSDPSKAKICLILGLGITVAYFVYIASYDSSSDDTPQLITNQQEREIQTDRAAEEAKYQAELERQRVAEEASASKFDPIIVNAAKKYLPDMGALPKEILKQCLAVDSYSDYQNLALAIALLEDEMTQAIIDLDDALIILEIQGYDEHPEVGPLISETRQIAGDASDCLRTVDIIYGN